MEILLSNFTTVTFPQIAMWIIGAVLIYLAIKKEMEPSLLLPMGFGAILINLPNSGAQHIIDVLFRVGVDNEFGELMPLILFIGIGAMIDFILEMN